MKPRNAREREVVRLYNQLPELTNSQRLWIEKCVVGTAIHTTGHRCWCTKCGGEWKMKQVGKMEICPHCGTESKVIESRKTHIMDHGYIRLFQMCGGWQVIRYVLIRWDCEKGREQRIYNMNVIQKWCQPGKPMITLGTALSYSPWYQKIPYSLWGYALTIKPNHNDWYGEWMECKTYPRKSLHPIYVKNLGKNPSFAVFDAPTLLGDIFGCPYLESLYKEDKYDRLVFMLRQVDYINKYWPSVRVALRHGYEPEHWPTYWEHLKALRFLHYDMRSPRYVATKDFGQLHELVMRQYKNKIDELQRKANEARELRWAMQAEERERLQAEYAKENAKTFADRIAHFEGLQIEDEDIVIAPLMTIDAFKEEGDAMHHCVFTGGYYRHKDSLILSARTRTENARIETIEVSLATYTILQSQGIYNVPTDKHEQIHNLVMGAMQQIRQMAVAI